MPSDMGISLSFLFVFGSRSLRACLCKWSVEPFDCKNMVNLLQSGSLQQERLVRCEGTLHVRCPPDWQDSGYKNPGNK